MLEANQIKIIRKELGYTQKHFSSRLEIPIGTLRKYEQDLTQDVPSSFLRKMWEQFQVNPLWVLAGQGPMILGSKSKFDDMADFPEPIEPLPKRRGPTIRRGGKKGEVEIGYVMRDMSTEEEEKLFQPLNQDEVKQRDRLYSLYRVNEDFHHFCDVALYLRMKKY